MADDGAAGPEPHRRRRASAGLRIDALRATVDAIAMTTDERVLAEVREIKDRLDKLETFADQARGAITLVKFVASFLGLGGVAAIVAVLSRGGL